MQLGARGITIVVIAFLVACSKPTDAVITSDVSTWDKELAPVLQKLPQADRELVAAYLMRAKMGEVLAGGKGVPIGTTVGQAIEDQKKFAAELAAREQQEAALKKKLEAERAALVEQINKAVTVTLVAKAELPKNFDAGRYSEYQQFTIGVQNNGDKELAGVAGELKFIDIFDKEVGSVTFRISQKIAPSGSYVWKGGRDYNQFVAEHRSVWNLEEGKYKTRFVPSALVFADGTKLTMPD